MRAHYEALINDPAQIERILLAGAEKARALSQPFIGRLRHAVGLRRLEATAAATTRKAAKAARPSFKQYRDSDGQFYFKLLDAQGELLLQSRAFASPQDAGRAIGRLQQERGAALPALAEQLEPADNDRMRAATEALEALATATLAASGG